MNPVIWHEAVTVIAVCSAAHSLLPPWDFLNEYPRAQRAYKLLIYIVGYVALNARSTMYPILSTGNGTGPSIVGASCATGANGPAGAEPNPDPSKPSN
jgi:hypothetical protein